MGEEFDRSLAEFGAIAAALNARALARSGLLEDFEVGVMHTYLGFLDAHAEASGRDGDRQVAAAIRDCLPSDLGL